MQHAVNWTLFRIISTVLTVSYALCVSLWPHNFSNDEPVLRNGTSNLITQYKLSMVHEGANLALRAGHDQSIISHNNNNNNSKVVRFCKLSMEKWNTRLILKTKQDVMQSQTIHIRRGKFQGRLSFAITLLHCTYSINKRVEQSWLWVSSTCNWEENKSPIVYGWPETAR